MRGGLFLLVLAAGSLNLAGALAQPASAQEDPGGAEAAEAYGRAARAQKNNAFDLASEEWEKFLQQYPKDPLAPRAGYYLGVCRKELKQLQPAAEAFRRMLKQAPEHELAEDARLNLGWCLYTLGREDRPEQLAQAAATFAELRQRHPQGKYSDQALFFQAEAQYAGGKQEQAIPLYRQLLQEHPDSRFAIDAAYALGVALEEAKQFAEAGKTYDEFLRLHPDHELAPEVRMRKAETLLRSGQAEAAEQMFAQAAALADFALADHALMRQAACLVQLGRDAEAAELFAAFPGRFPKSSYGAEAALNAGRSLYRLQRDQEASQWFRQCWEGQKNTEAAHWLVRLHLRNGRPGEGELLAKEAVAAAEGENQARLQLDLADAVYADPQRREQALKLYLDLVDSRPTSGVAPQSLYNAAFAAMELQRHEQALALAERFAKQHPQDDLAPDAQYVAAESLLQLKRYQEAAEKFAALISAHPKRSERASWVLRRAWALYLPQHYAEVIDYLGGLADTLTEPTAQAEARFLLGSSRFHLDQFAEAQGELERSLELAPQGSRAAESLLLLSRVLQQLKRTDEAIAAAQRVATEYPASGLLDQAYYRLGEYCYGAQRFEEAEVQYGKSWEAAQDGLFSPFALNGQAWCRIKLMRFADAAELLTILLQRFPEHALAAEARFGRALALRQDGKYDQALRELTELSTAQPAGPRQADAMYERALALSGLQRSPEAVEVLQQLLREHPQYAGADKALYELGWTCKSLQQELQAAEAFAELAQKHPESPLAAEAWYHVGQHRYDAQEFAPAAEAYQASAAATQSNELKEKALYKLGWAQFQQENYAEAEKTFAQQAALGPDLSLHADARFMQAESVFRAPDYPRAHALFQKLLEDGLKPPADTAQVLLRMHAGQAAAQVKDWEASAAALQSLLTEQPESPYLPEARVELGWALQNLKKSQEALDQFAKSGARGALAARADFLSGEIFFELKDFDAAIKQYRKVMFLYDAKTTPGADIWQSQAGFEAARAAEVQMGAAADPATRREHLDNARTFYQYVIQNHAQSSYAKKSAERLKQLEKL